MAFDVSIITDFIVTSFKSLFKLLGDLILGIQDFGEVILLGISLLLAFIFIYNYDKKRNIKFAVVWIVVGLLLWLVFKLSTGVD